MNLHYIYKVLFMRVLLNYLFLYPFQLLGVLKYIRIAGLWIWFAFITTFFSFFFLFRPRHRNNLYLLTHTMCIVGKWILGIKLTVYNKEGLYKDTPCIYMANHQSLFDMFVFGDWFPKDAFIVGKKSLKKIPFFGWTFSLSGNVYIDRNNKEKSINTMASAEKEIIEKKRSLFIFPEGTRSNGKGLGKFKKGAFHVSINTGRPLLPLVSTDYVLKLNKITSASIKVTVLEPIYIKAADLLEKSIEEVENRYKAAQKAMLS